MPTPVSLARQCLAGEAVVALDEAVVVARRRCHAQTTTLHVVSAVLSLPTTSTSSSSILRDALQRARSAAYTHHFQFKALELCFSVALDRLPSSSSSSSSSSNGQMSSNSGSESDPPPISNSLMAAVRRSQANQRRNPESFHLYHHIQQQQQLSQSPTFSGVKVELQQLILSILDDPIVSRVFGEAGFRSCDIRYAVLRPPPTSILRFPRSSRCPPLFLCNFSTAGDEFDSISRRSFSFPFSRQMFYSDGSDENCRRIGEVLVRKKGRNPLLVGAGAADALQDLSVVLSKEKWSCFPQEIVGSQFLSLEKDLLGFLSAEREIAWLESRIQELSSKVSSAENSTVVSVGDLKGFLDEGSGGEEEKQEGLEYVVSELTRLLAGDQNGRVWLVGSSASYETYMKFLAKFPSVDNDWDLQLLPIISVRGSLHPKPSSLMDSFVPFGGFFPMASSSVISPSKPQKSATQCHYCTEKYEEEVAEFFKENSIPVDEMQKSSIHSWLPRSSFSFGNLDMARAKDDGTILNNKVADIQKKWNEICQCLHQGSNIVDTNAYGQKPGVFPRSESFPRIVGFPNNSDQISGDQVYKNINFTQGQDEGGNTISWPVSFEKTSPKTSLSTPASSEISKGSELKLTLSKNELLVTDLLQSHLGSQLRDQTSSPSVAVSTDLALGNAHVSPCKMTKPILQALTPCDSGLSRCFSARNSEMASGSVTTTPIQSPPSHSCSNSPVASGMISTLSPSSSSAKGNGASGSIFENSGINSSKISPQFNPRDFKLLCRSLTDTVRRQEEAICAISEVIMRCKSGNGRHHVAGMRGDIWLGFLGPDRTAKKMIAMALAELLFGNKERLICIDLGLEDDVNVFNKRTRGKMVVDHIAEEISRLPWSVVLLENVDKADFLVQSCLSQATQTGRFSDSHGREISTSNKIFIITTREVRDKTNSPEKESATFLEEKILAAQGWQMKILIESALKPLDVDRYIDEPISSRRESATEYFSPSVFINKRKLSNASDAKEDPKSSETAKRSHKSLNTFLDLNLPFEETTEKDADCSSDGSNCASSDSSAIWLDDFFSNVDETVAFKPFNFDALAENILTEITKSFKNTTGSKCKLEIDPKAMEQMLAATWSLEEGVGALSNWSQIVLARSFMDVGERYNLSAHTILRLVCEDVLMVEHAPGILLPARIGLA